MNVNALNNICVIVDLISVLVFLVTSELRQQVTFVVKAVGHQS